VNVKIDTKGHGNVSMPESILNFSHLDALPILGGHDSHANKPLEIEYQDHSVKLAKNSPKVLSSVILDTSKLSAAKLDKVVIETVNNL